MEDGIPTGDVLIGILAAAGVVVLVIVFIWVVHMVFLENREDDQDV